MPHKIGEESYSGTMVEGDFIKEKSNPCAFKHRTRDLSCAVHGDDFTALGDEDDLDWFVDLLSKVYNLEVKSTLGPEAHDDVSVRVLNRIVSYTNEGIEIEPEERHVEILK